MSDARHTATGDCYVGFSALNLRLRSTILTAAATAVTKLPEEGAVCSVPNRINKALEQNRCEVGRCCIYKTTVERERIAEGETAEKS